MSGYPGGQGADEASAARFTQEELKRQAAASRVNGAHGNAAHIVGSSFPAGSAYMTNLLADSAAAAAGQAAFYGATAPSPFGGPYSALSSQASPYADSVTAALYRQRYGYGAAAGVPPYAGHEYYNPHFARSPQNLAFFDRLTQQQKAAAGKTPTKSPAAIAQKATPTPTPSKTGSMAVGGAISPKPSPRGSPPQQQKKPRPQMPGIGIRVAAVDKAKKTLTNKDGEVLPEPGDWFPGCVPLGVEDDKYWLSELQVYLRSNFAEAFGATEDDIAAPMHGRNKPIALGQVGIRCMHCKNENPAERGQQATSYPSLISGIYNSVQQMLRLHLDCCQAMPPDVRAKIETLKLSSSSRGGRKQYWIDSAKRLGLTDTTQGIHFGRDPTGPLPPLEGPSVNSKEGRKKKEVKKKSSGPGGIETPQPAASLKDDEACFREKISKLLESEESIEMDVILSSAESLGAKCSTGPVEGGGALLFAFKKDGQLQKALGNAAIGNAESHVVLWKVNGVVLEHYDHLFELINTAKKGGKSLNCLLVMHEATDLSQIDQSKLVLGDTANPRRRNGDSFSLEKQLPPPKTSVATHDGNTASRQDETKDLEGEADFSAEWDNNDDYSDSDDSARLKKKKKSVSKKGSTSSKTSTPIPSTANEATTRRKEKGKDASNLESFNSLNDSDSDNDDPPHADLKKRKRISKKKKDSMSKAIATNNARSPTGKCVSQSADSVVADDAPIQKKARTVPSKKTISDRSTSTSGSTASANPSHTANSSQMRANNQNETSASQKTNNSSLGATSRGTNTANSSGRATSTGLASDPLSELLSAPSKPKAKQKRTPSMQSIDEPAGKKHKGSDVVEPNRNAARQVPRRNSNEPKGSVSMREYEAQFPSREPIGAFFKTEGSKCKVFSIFKKGNAKEDIRIQPGTIAVAASISGKRQEVSSHEQLRELYIQAKQRQSKIHIVFVNTDVFGHRMDMQSDRDWTEYGVWTNRYEGGWAGGAKTKNGVAYMTKRLASNRESSAATSMRTARTENHANHREKISAPQKSQVRDKDSTRESSSDPKARKPLIRPSSIREVPSVAREGRKVKFSDDNSLKYFVVGSATDQWHDPSHTTSDEITTESQQLSPADALKDAVTNHPYTKLIEVLETGVTSEFDITGSALQNHYDYVKQAMNTSNGERRRDMKLKKKILGIYIPVCLHIEQVMELQRTSYFEFWVKIVRLTKKPNISRVMGRTETLNGRVFLKYGKDVVELGSLHKTNTKAFVSYDKSELKVFMARGNKRLRLSKCNVFIDFREGAGGDAVPAAKLGNVTIPLGHIDRQVPIDTSWDNKWPLKVRPDSIISKGAVEIEFRRFKVDRPGDTIKERMKRERLLKDRIIKEKEDLTKSLKEQISFIKRFNDDFGDGRIRLSGNIQSMGNATLLHAAINLSEEGMVKQLLDIGADPRAKSSRFGTPIQQAMNLKDRSLEKLQHLINNGEPSERTEPVQQLFDKYSRILRLLNSNEEEELPDDMKGSSDDSDSDDDQDYPGGKSTGSQRRGASGNSEADQKKRQFEIMAEIFSRAPKAAGGLEDGLEANKCFVSGILRLHYSKECPDVPAMKKFVNEAIRRKVLVSISETKYRLGAATGSQEPDASAKKTKAPLPETPLGWMHAGKRVCPFFDRGGRCRYGHQCHNVHIYRYPSDKKSRLVLESKELLKAKKDRFVLKTEYLKTMNLDGWFTAGYYNAKKSKSMYFYAEGGKGKANRFGVYWYPTLHEAKEALQRVITANTLDKRRWRDILFHEEVEVYRSPAQLKASSRSKEVNQSLPLLKDRDWMDKSAEFPRFPSGADPKSYQNQDFWRVEARFGNTIGHQLKIFLNPDDVYTKEENGFYTTAFADRQHNKIIYVEGGNSRINDQGVHWYSSESEARNALEPVVSASRRRSAAN
mmetsp:Transcript_44912/g.108527  ORF Transcript_44912/g.108527 Transcript_44912/m.108527 type:complete len:1914 (-) Transcript_44912:641-6382(-)